MSNFLVDDLKRVFRGGKALYQLMIINAVVFVFFNLLDVILAASAGITVSNWFGLSAQLIDNVFKPWSIITYNFMHAGFWHILSNLIWLYIFGRILQEYQGNKKVTFIYLVGGVSGGILYLIIYNLVFLLGIESYSFHPSSILVGASASVMAIVVATATLLPNYTVQFILLPPIKIKYVALVMFILTSILDLSENTGGKLAHIGGALFGYFYIRNLQFGNGIMASLENILDSFRDLFKSKPKMRVAHREHEKAKKNSKASEKEKQQQIDAILDKISKSGYESLTKEEKELLFKMGNER